MQVHHSLRHSTPTFHPRPALQTQGTRGGREQQWAARGDQDGAAKALGEGLRPGPDPGPRPRAAHVALRLGTATLGATVRRTSGVSSPSFPDEPLSAPRSCRADVYTNRRKAQLGSLWGSARGFAGGPGFARVPGAAVLVTSGVRPRGARKPPARSTVRMSRFCSCSPSSNAQAALCKARWLRRPRDAGRQRKARSACRTQAAPFHCVTQRPRFTNWRCDLPPPKRGALKAHSGFYQ